MKDKKIGFLQHFTIKGISFDIVLEYFYNEEYDYFYEDSKLGNKNLKKIKKKYDSIQKEKNQL